MDKIQSICFKRRSLVLGILKGTSFSFVAGYLYTIQKVKNSFYSGLSQKNRTNKFFFSGERGEILDCQQRLICKNQISYRLLLDIRYVEDYKKRLKEIGKILKHQIKTLSLDRPVYFEGNILVVIKEDLNWEILNQLELYAYQFPDLIIQEYTKRIYEFKSSMAHVIGYIGSPNKTDLAHKESLAKIPSLKIGKTGLERFYEEKLQGVPGFKCLERDAHRRIIKTLKLEGGGKGQNLHLTIDALVQEKIFHLFEQKDYLSGSCVVMDVLTGDIKACVSYPSYDPNFLTLSGHLKEWDLYSKDPSKPFLNRSIQGLYPPASTFKIIVALAALEMGVEKTYSAFCPGYKDIGGHRFYCWKWKNGGHGPMDFTSAIAQSCDVFFYSLISRLQIHQVAEFSKMFGLGSKTGIDLFGEKEGLVPSPSWKESRHKKSWTLGDSFNFSIGQGYLLTTPIQLVRMVAAFVNGGYLFSSKLSAREQTKNFIKVKKEHLEIIKTGMDKTVNHPLGTGHSAFWSSPQGMGGKTGSCQVSRLTEKARSMGLKPSDLPIHLRDHAFFVGYSPVENPRFAISVIIEHGMFGGKVAGVMAQEVFKILFNQTNSII